jgi:hypothetical protein
MAQPEQWQQVAVAVAGVLKIALEAPIKIIQELLALP